MTNDELDDEIRSLMHGPAADAHALRSVTGEEGRAHAECECGATWDGTMREVGQAWAEHWIDAAWAQQRIEREREDTER